jgi:hypothetical protein
MHHSTLLSRGINLFTKRKINRIDQGKEAVAGARQSIVSADQQNEERILTVLSLSS